MNRRQFLTAAAGIAIAVGVPACAATGSKARAQSAVAVTRVFGNGMNLVAVAVKYSHAVQAAALQAEDFSVNGFTISRVYTSDSADGKPLPQGRYVIIAIKPQTLVVKNKPSAAQQVQNTKGKGPGTAGDVKESAPSLAGRNVAVTVQGQSLTAAISLNEAFDDFKQFEFYDKATGKTVRYNLFAPKNQTAGERYPLVLFMHDAGVTGKNNAPLAALYQGNGATAWAEPAAQAKNPCFVLAPQFDEIIADDQSQTSDYLDATLNLIRDLETRYAIDPARRYTTGQSSGGMMSIAMNVKYPDFFAATYLVACQWNPAVVAPLAKNKIWITVSQDDSKAYPGQTAIVEVLAKHGAKVARGEWNAQWSAAEFQTAFDKMDAQQANINFVSFEKGTVFTEGESAAGAGGHTNTWQYAYNIAPVREWIFRWHK
ncbi:alpha/beta hydrolase-fold protein [Neisseria iguanae]|uniref:Acyl-CoA:diacylglycerol acyltransferase n=1 Tax=Neisseria iguanae TaxID=90242 RepID=A0A2P7TYU3_9NEIS|nr:alpha/beta hydrolase-fold protein [Neisseria iguanae]PSJ79877.1 Tat pathway signal protein [Neisseria iguanae]